MRTIMRIYTGVLLYITGMKEQRIQNRIGNMVKKGNALHTPEALALDANLKKQQKKFKMLERRFERLTYVFDSEKVSIESVAYQLIGMKELTKCVKSHWKGKPGMVKDTNAANQGYYSEFDTFSGFGISVLTYEDLTETFVRMDAEINPDIPKDFKFLTHTISISQRAFDNLDHYDIEFGLRTHFGCEANKNDGFPDDADHKFRTTHRDIDGMEFWIISDFKKSVTTILIPSQIK